MNRGIKAVMRSRSIFVALLFGLMLETVSLLISFMLCNCAAFMLPTSGPRIEILPFHFAEVLSAQNNLCLVLVMILVQLLLLNFPLQKMRLHPTTDKMTRLLSPAAILWYLSLTFVTIFMFCCFIQS